MASNEVEVLDPTATVEKLPETASGSTLNRRHFMAALGVAGVAAAGAGLASSSPDAQAQIPAQNGYQQTDVLNFLLNIKYLKATFYSWLTVGTDLPDDLTIGSGILQAIPQETVKSLFFTYPAAGASKLTVSTTGPVTQQVFDMLTEAYYDELQQLYDLRALLGSLAINRPALNIQGNMQSSGQILNTTATVTFSAITQNLALGIARLLEDLSATAFAYATQYLSGANLNYATQILASDSFHAGAIRLACIQNGVPYLATQISTNTYTSSTTLTGTNFNGSTTSGSAIVYGIASTATVTNTFPTVGQIVTGAGIPANTTVIATATPNNATSAIINGIITKGSTAVTMLDINTGLPLNLGSTGQNPLYLAAGQPVTGTYVPANTVIQSVNTTTGIVTLSKAASASVTIAPTGIISSGKATITGLSSVAGLIPLQPISAYAAYNGSTAGAFPSTATIVSINADNTVTMSALATASSTFVFQGLTTSGSALITGASSTTGLVIGQSISGPGIPDNTTIIGYGNDVLLSQNITITSSGVATFTAASPCTITFPATEAITFGTGSITLSNNATATATPVTIISYTADNSDVAPADNGTSSSTGPAVYASTSPAIYQAFFNTAGTATGSGGTPAGFAFARTFSQVLQVLYNGVTTQTTQVTTGGFFPSGVSGTITAV